MDQISELLITDTGVDKLGKRDISPDEAQQLPRNAHLTVRNPSQPDGAERCLLIGRTDGGRTLTFVIEATLDPTTWLIVTGWESTSRERKLLRS